MIEWKTSQQLVPYEDALDAMDARAAAIREQGADELVWFLEHPPLYTAGTSAKAADLLEPRFPVYKAGRGGEYTYHGPGQRVGYVMLDLKARAIKRHSVEKRNLLNHGSEDPGFRRDDMRAMPDVRAYVCQLEKWIIKTLERFDIKGECREGRIGVWVPATPRLRRMGYTQEKKIAALGVRIRRWVTMHGFALNVSPDLSHFGGIVPCGISEFGVTSIAEVLGRDVSMAEVDAALKASWDEIFLS